jgi:hypothetical protein
MTLLWKRNARSKSVTLTKMWENKLGALSVDLEWPDIEATLQRVCAAYGLSDQSSPAFPAQRPTCLPRPY